MLRFNFAMLVASLDLIAFNLSFWVTPSGQLYLTKCCNEYGD